MNKSSLLLVLVLVFGGCKTVSAIDREQLADPVIVPELERDGARLRSHVYEVREISRGGLVLEGAGCGCN